MNRESFKIGMKDNHEHLIILSVCTSSNQALFSAFYVLHREGHLYIESGLVTPVNIRYIMCISTPWNIHIFLLTCKLPVCTLYSICQAHLLWLTFCTLSTQIVCKTLCGKHSVWIIYCYVMIKFNITWLCVIITDTGVNLYLMWCVLSYAQYCCCRGQCHKGIQNIVIHIVLFLANSLTR